MLFVAPLSKEEIISLKEMTKNHPLSWTRMRANAIILSTEGIPLKNIANIHGVCREPLKTY